MLSWKVANCRFALAQTPKVFIFEIGRSSTPLYYFVIFLLRGIFQDSIKVGSKDGLEQYEARSVHSSYLFSSLLHSAQFSPSSASMSIQNLH